MAHLKLYLNGTPGGTDGEEITDATTLKGIMKYGFVLPGDILQLDLPDDTGEQLVVVTKSNFGRPGLNVISANNVNAGNYTVVSRPVDEVPETIVSMPSEVFAYILDFPKVPQDTSSSDEYVYIAIGAKSFYGANVYRSYDNGISYEHQMTFTGAGVFGEAVTTLPEGVPQYWDNGHTVDVKLVAGVLESHTKEEVLNFANAAVLGEEVIQFRNAELIGENTYRLKGLLRGRNGTEHMVSSHVAGERFVLITTTGVSALPIAVSDWYTNVKLRIGPRNSSVLNESYKDYDFTPQAIMARPWSVCSLKAKWQNGECNIS